MQDQDGKRGVPDAGGTAVTGSAGSGNAPARADGSGLRRASGTVSPGSKKQKKPEPRGEKRTLDEGEVMAADASRQGRVGASILLSVGWEGGGARSL